MTGSPDELTVAEALASEDRCGKTVAIRGTLLVTRLFAYLATHWEDAKGILVIEPSIERRLMDAGACPIAGGFAGFVGEARVVGRLGTGPPMFPRSLYGISEFAYRDPPEDRQFHFVLFERPRAIELRPHERLTPRQVAVLKGFIHTDENMLELRRRLTDGRAHPIATGVSPDQLQRIERGLRAAGIEGYDVGYADD